MDLVHRRELRARQQRGDRPPPVLVDQRALVIAAIADVETGELARRNAATPAEKAVRHGRQRARPNDFDAHAKPAGGGQAGEWIAKTLNNAPIPSSPVRRSSAASISLARSG
jgi:hypothetical protein